jgi:hypothetical protein
MNRFEKSEQGKKFLRVPAGLRRKLEKVIYESRTVLSGCPFGNDIRVTIQVEYVPKGGPDLRLDVQIKKRKIPRGPHMVQSAETFGEEYFEALLRAPLREVDTRFVCFFQSRHNESASPLQWMREGFSEMGHVKRINSLCRRHRLNIRFAETGEYEVEEGMSATRLMKYKFYALERAKKARE